MWDLIVSVPDHCLYYYFTACVCCRIVFLSFFFSFFFCLFYSFLSSLLALFTQKNEYKNIQLMGK